MPTAVESILEPTIIPADKITSINSKSEKMAKANLEDREVAYDKRLVLFSLFRNAATDAADLPEIHLDPPNVKNDDGTYVLPLHNDFVREWLRGEYEHIGPINVVEDGGSGGSHLIKTTVEVIRYLNERGGYKFSSHDINTKRLLNEEFKPEQFWADYGEPYPAERVRNISLDLWKNTLNMRGRGKEQDRRVEIHELQHFELIDSELERVGFSANSLFYEIEGYEVKGFFADPIRNDPKYKEGRIIQLGTDSLDEAYAIWAELQGSLIYNESARNFSSPIMAYRLLAGMSLFKKDVSSGEVEMEMIIKGITEQNTDLFEKIVHETNTIPRAGVQHDLGILNLVLLAQGKLKQGQDVVSMIREQHTAGMNNQEISKQLLEALVEASQDLEHIGSQILQPHILDILEYTFLKGSHKLAGIIHDLEKDNPQAKSAIESKLREWKQLESYKESKKKG